MNKENTCQHVCTWKLESGFTCQHIYINMYGNHLWKVLIFPCMFYILKENLQSFFFFWRSRKCPYIKSSSLHHYICIYMPMMTPQGNHYHGSRLHQHCGSIPPSSKIYIYIYIKKKHLQVWRGEDFSQWIQVGLKNTQRSSQVYQLLSHLYKKKKSVYRNDKLEEVWKCKASRKMKWSLKKNRKEIFFWKKNRKLPIKIYLWKKITSRPTSSIWQCMYVMHLEVGAFVDIKIINGLNYH